jgi:TetR/AcrR family acrAB operon transcriptional repressor
MAQVTPQAPPAALPRGERTRQRILHAAAQRFAASGFSRTTVEQIAADAGVSKGIVYHHFRGKEPILEALLERTLDDWSRASGIAAHVARAGSVLAGLEHALRGSLDYAKTNPLVRALFQLDPLVVLGLGSSAAVQRSVADGRAQMIEAMRAGIASGELRGDLDPERAADLLRLVIIAFVDNLLDPRWIDTSDDALVATCLDVLRRGLRAEERP